MSEPNTTINNQRTRQSTISVHDNQQSADGVATELAQQ